VRRLGEVVITSWLFRWIVTLARDERGQDIVEYALLSALIGVMGIAAWDAIAGGIGNAYSDWDFNTQDLWEPDDPVGP